MKAWEEIKKWHKRHRTFCVEIKHWINPLLQDRGEHMWNVYANIFDSHPLFNIFNNQTQKDIDELEGYLHWGITYKREITSLQRLYDPDKVKTVVIGSDYNHLHDKRFTHMATLEEASEVKDDAEALFSYLLEKSNEEGAEADE
jgi:hemoglobin-like flavoprotein